MEHALTLARKGIGLASPNPSVGCVVVRGGEIVGEGFHQYDRRDHAEIVALRSAGEKARGATLYVTLEPCDHTGRTGPCTQAIMTAGVHKVIAAMQDPNPATSGRGFAQLRAAGIEVTSGLLEEGARGLNEPFACWIRSKKPLVTLKSALTLDGQLASPQIAKRLPRSSSPSRRGAVAARRRTSSTWITSEESHAEVHRMRHASDALLSGIGTVLADDPLLTDRSGLPRRRRLLRVILDTKLRLSSESRIVKTAVADLLVFTAAHLDSRKARKLQRSGVELANVRTRGGDIDLAAVLADLGQREILSVLLEAGPSLNGAALAADLVDKLVLFYAPKISGKSDVPFASARGVLRAPLRRLRIQQFGPDFAVECYLHDVYRNAG
jgi:diaminohydroxyphosphoribosylaminopyrimidine deaminase/5-amino-6-(5-phosphoribosylamino)uracil reductase